MHELMGRVARGLELLDLVWSEELLAETRRSLVEKKGLSEDAATRWAGYLPQNFPDGETDLGGAATSVELSALTDDPDDHHVCRLAIASGAAYLFTHDRGYLRSALQGHGIEVTAPDSFLAAAFDEAPRDSSICSSGRRPTGREGVRSASCWPRSNGPGRSALPARRAQRLAPEREHGATGTGPRDFRHFWREVPDSLHIYAYPFISALNIHDLADDESPANGLIKDQSSRDDLPNCHAEGRGFESLQPLRRESHACGRVDFGAGCRNQSNHPRISPIFQALM